MPDCELIEAEIEYYEAACEYDDAQITYWQAEKAADYSALITSQMMWWYYCNGARAAGTPAIGEPGGSLERRDGAHVKYLSKLKAKVDAALDRKAKAKTALLEIYKKRQKIQ